MKATIPNNYSYLWRDLVRLGEQRRQYMKNVHLQDQWHGKAKEFDQRVRNRWQKKDSSRTFLNHTLKKFPEATILDIGAGSGAWISLMTPRAKKVTAIDSSASMLAQLSERVKHEELENVEIINGCWPEVDVDAHDICFCSHSMYGAEDLPLFIQKMQSVARKRVILLMRAPQPGGLMAKAAKLVWGHPYDSPNYQIAMNILWEMGIYPNVIMEEENLWKPWSHPSVEEALFEMKSRLGLFDTQQWDKPLLKLLNDNLRYQDYEYIWPTSMRTTLLYWDV